MGAQESLKGNPKLIGVVPKNHFVSLSFFREPPLINWDYTKACLLTACDFYRSSDFWTDSVLNSGKTLKEALVELGFPKDNTLVVDTGVFEIEAKKAGIARDLGIEINIQLSNRDIFAVYDISGGDFFVSPDEIILAMDDPSTIQTKVNTIKQNLLETLEHVPSSKIIGVIQGQTPEVIDYIFNFYVEQGIKHFAAGGLIPLYFHDKSLFQKVVRYIRKVTEGYHLHAFGLPIVKLLPYYLHKLGFDSVDTSTLLYLSARRRYLVSDNPIPVRLADFTKCNCSGCKFIAAQQPHPRHSEFFIHLYIHNVCEATKLANASSLNSSNQENSSNNPLSDTRPKNENPVKKEGTGFL
jgi:hypothetical protein